MIGIRKLAIEDAIGMLEWMHDKDIQKFFRKNMKDKSLDDVYSFINAFSDIDKSLKLYHEIHFAICDINTNEYYGTISLKNIDDYSDNAEIAIVTRKKCRGMNVGFESMNLVLDYAFNFLKLNKVYLNVLADNNSAVSLYKRCGFQQEGYMKNQVRIGDKYKDLMWFGLQKEDYVCEK